MERLGKNQGRYHGETIDIDRVTGEIYHLALNCGWECDTFLDAPSLTLRGYRRLVPGSEKKLYVSTGIHGDEPSGPLAIQQIFQENAWPQDCNIWLVPCLNPTGFRQNTRENALGIDLNRDYRHLSTVEVRSHVEWLQRQPRFDLTLILHEDWEANGFYVYELNPHSLPSLCEGLLEKMRGICPIETAELVDNWECRNGIIRPHFNPEQRAQWAEAIYLVVNQSFRSYTVETPSDYPLPLRVKAHVHAVKTIFQMPWASCKPATEFARGRMTDFF